MTQILYIIYFVPFLELIEYTFFFKFAMRIQLKWFQTLLEKLPLVPAQYFTDSTNTHILSNLILYHSENYLLWEWK